MEKFIYCFLPSFMFLKLLIDDKDNFINIICKYFLLTLFSNILCFFICMKYFRKIALEVTLSFSIKYILMSLVINLILAIAYKCIKNIVDVKLEVVYDKKKKDKKHNS